jgi:UDP-glucose 4-epimerase
VKILITGNMGYVGPEVVKHLRRSRPDAILHGRNLPALATACGMSDRLRLDLVLNDFVACALSRGEISVLSDGSPWRPLIDVADMARAIDWAIDRRAENGGRYLAVNAGSDDRNYQVKDFANAVAAKVSGTEISINVGTRG